MRIGTLLMCMFAALLAAALHAGTARAEVVWLCEPGLEANPCEIPLDTTVQDESGGGTVKTPKRIAQGRRPVDCFYVYPTVSNQTSTNATKARDPELESIAKFQASRFSTECRIFAPIYRQITLAAIPAFGMSGEGSPASVAFSDVLEAWRDYLADDNGGRGVVLVGHSQGTIMLRKLIRTEIEANPEQRRLLVGAFLLGGNVTVAEGERIGGDFRETPTCSTPGQFGCVVAYSTYSTDSGPAPFFGNTDTDFTANAFDFPSGAGFEVACTDPGTLGGEAGPVGVTIPSEEFAPGPINAGIVATNGGPPPTAPTTWVEAPDRFTGACRSVNDANVYRYDPVEGSRRPNEFPPAWGTHLLDVNLGLDRLRGVMRDQAGSWLSSNLSVGKAKRNRRRRTAKLPVGVPGAGKITVKGRGLRAREVKASGPRSLRLKVVPRGRARRALRQGGRVRVKARVVYDPAVGPPTTVVRKVRLRQSPAS